MPLTDYNVALEIRDSAREKGISNLSSAELSQLIEAQDRISRAGIGTKIGAATDRFLADPFGTGWSPAETLSGALGAVGRQFDRLPFLDGQGEQVGQLVGQMIIDSLPSLATSTVASSLARRHPLLGAAVLLGGAALEGARTYARTEDPLATAGSTINMPLAYGFGAMGRGALNLLAGKRGSMLRDFTTNFVGSALADAVDIGLQPIPGETATTTVGKAWERISQNVPDFFLDPVQATAYTIFQVAPAAAMSAGRLVKPKPTPAVSEASTTSEQELRRFYSEEQPTTPEADFPRYWVPQEQARLVDKIVPKSLYPKYLAYVPFEYNGRPGLLMTRSFMNSPGMAKRAEELGFTKITERDVSPESFDPSGKYIQLEMDKLYSVEAPQERVGEFINNLTEAFRSATTPKIKGYRVKGPAMQVGQDGKMSTAGLKKWMSKWMPNDIKGLVDFEQLPERATEGEILSWMQKNLPKVEVRRLRSTDDVLTPIVQRRASAIHKLESEGYQVVNVADFQASGYAEVILGNDLFVATPDAAYKYQLDTEGKIVPKVQPETIPLDQLPPSLLEYFQAHKDYILHTLQSGTDIRIDSPTFIYSGINPIPPDRMDRPVDTVVRLDDPETFFKEGTHLPDHTNVIGFGRGYFARPDAFFLFEVQSDWATSIRKEAQRIPASERTSQRSRLGDFVESRYTPLVLKAVIRHALEEGATRLIIPDEKTAMMIERHDIELAEIRRRDREGFPVSEKSRSQMKKIERGMTHFYRKDGQLFSILKRLGAKFIDYVDLGNFSTRAGSEYFDVYDSTEGTKPKTNITGFEFDITNLNPNEFRLFSLFDGAAQADLNSRAARFEQPQTNFETLTVDQLMQKLNEEANNPEWMEKILGEFIHGIKGVDPKLIINAFESSDGIGGFYSRSEGINVNVKSEAGKVFGRAVHEISHHAQEESKRYNPERFQEAIDIVWDMGPAIRAEILTKFQQATGAYHLNIDYLSGRLVDTNSPHAKEVVMREFVSGITEMMAYAKFHGKKPKTGLLSEYLLATPPTLRGLIGRAIQLLQKVFGKFAPSGRYMVRPELGKAIQDSVNLVSELVFKAEQADARAFELLRNFETAFDPGTMISEFQRGNIMGTQLDFSLLPKGFPLDKKFFSVESPQYGEKGFETLGGYWKTWASGIGTAHVYPFTRQIFNLAHRFRPTIQAYLTTYRGILAGEDVGEGGIWREGLALKKLDSELVALGSNPARMKRISAAIMEDQRRIHKLSTEGGKAQTDAELKARGLTDEDISFLKRLRAAVTQAGKDALARDKLRDTLGIARLLVGGTNITVDDARTVAQNLVGGQELEAIYAQKGTEAGDAAAREHFAKVLKEAGVELVQEPDGSIPFLDLLVKKNRLNTERRLEMAKQFLVEGYMPMTRRRRYIVKLIKYLKDYKPDYSKMEVHDFDSAQEAREFAKKHEGKFDRIFVLDTQGLGERYEAYAHSSLLDFFEQQAKTFDGIVEKYLSRINNDDPKAELLKSALADIAGEFRHNLSQELSDAISTGGDPYSRQRKMIKGFREGDFIPNALEYIDVKTITSIKRVAKAEVALEMMRPELVENIELRQKVEKDINYAFNATPGELTLFRKFVFNYYLAASVKQLIQNSFQAFQIAIPHFATKTNTWFDGYKQYRRANKLYFKMALEGWTSENPSTGDKRLDEMLKRGVAEGVLRPRALDYFMQSNDLDIDPSGIRGTAFGMHEKVAGARLQAKRAANVFQSFLNFPTAVTDLVQRKISFIMLADYRLRENPNATEAQLEQIYQEALNFVEDTNFVGDKVNRPGFIKNQMGNRLMHGTFLVGTSLMNHVINHFTLLGSYLTQGRIGVWVSPEKGRVWAARWDNPIGAMTNLKNPAIKAFWLNMLHIVALAGLAGLPFYQDLDNIIESIFGVSFARAIRRMVITAADYAGLDEWAQSKTADLVTAGLPGALGIDMTFSMGLGNVMNYNVYKPYGIADLGGAAGNLAQRIYSSASSFIENGINEATFNNFVRQMAPPSLTYFLRHYDTYYHGTYRSRSGQLATPGELSTGGRVSLVLGFQPLEASQYLEQKNRVKREEQELYRRRRAKVNQVAYMLNRFESSGDPSYLMKARELVGEMKRDDPYLDDDQLIDSITKEARDLKAPSLQAPGFRGQEIVRDVMADYPGARYPITSRVGQRVDAIRTAAMLGDVQGVMRKVASFSDNIANDVMYDSLVRGGVSPAVASALLGRDDRQIQNLITAMSRGDLQPPAGLMYPQ